MEDLTHQDSSLKTQLLHLRKLRTGNDSCKDRTVDIVHKGSSIRVHTRTIKSAVESASDDSSFVTKVVPAGKLHEVSIQSMRSSFLVDSPATTAGQS